ncbi:hypothetical protein MCOR34_001752 [Pyricularia oryzae]|uniref:Uncharacterized protein n=1 Tax=Pyricularia oryzae TaxID=318829 RepID=A0A4P7N7Z2_PYROR|nr:hypothetical protein MCOR01_000801 [Pyricularia oryzae]KAI6323766.1 hypothetical protein MCOR34_001752 [Pyricularia oryzae]KAI6475963.1 hypothetical protein MCOR17_001344 [Pyricularia oryzae]KAI6582924.1 hypothetical protein MCOR04_005167 [Pyricularia oryzae]KAI6589189.1 hypothetical protein MCOR06_005568 [Pyricularia oryzae]
MRSLDRSRAWAWVTLLAPLLALADTDAAQGLSNELYTSAYITLDLAESSPAHYLDIQLGVLQKKEPCAPAHVLLNHKPLESSNGNFASLIDDIPFTATWNITCVEANGLPAAQLFSFAVESVSGVAREQPLGFSLQFKQDSPGDIFDLQGPASMEVSQETYQTSLDEGTPEDFMSKVDELRRLRRDVVHLHRLIRRKEMHLARRHRWEEEDEKSIGDCDDFKCMIKTFLSTIGSVAKSWFWDDFADLFVGRGRHRHDRWRHRHRHRPHWRHPHGHEGNSSSHDGWRFPPPWERPHHRHRPPHWPPPGFAPDGHPFHPHHPSDRPHRRPHPPPGAPNSPEDHRPKHHSPRPDASESVLLLVVGIVLCIAILGLVVGMMHLLCCRRQDDRRDTNAGRSQRRSRRREANRRRRAKRRKDMGRFLARLFGRGTDDEDDEEKEAMLGSRQSSQSRASDYYSDFSDLEDGPTGMSIELSDFTESPAEAEVLPPYRAAVAADDILSDAATSDTLVDKSDRDSLKKLEMTTTSGCKDAPSGSGMT